MKETPVLVVRQSFNTVSRLFTSVVTFVNYIYINLTVLALFLYKIINL